MRTFVPSLGAAEISVTDNGSAIGENIVKIKWHKFIC